MDTIAKRIKVALDMNNMKQSELVEKTGIGKSSISTYLSGAYEPKQKNIYKIAEALNVNESWLMGYDVPMERNNNHLDTALILNRKDELDIAKRLENTLADLENSQQGLMFSGEPLDEETRELLKASLENSIRIAKINAKQKYTPKKYKKQ